MRRLETRRPRRVEVRWHTAKPRLKKELLPLAFPRQVAIERRAQNGVRFDPVVQSVNDLGDSLAATERLKRPCWRKQRCIARAASVTKVGLNLELC